MQLTPVGSALPGRGYLKFQLVYRQLQGTRKTLNIQIYPSACHWLIIECIQSLCVLYVQIKYSGGTFGWLQ